MKKYTDEELMAMDAAGISKVVEEMRERAKRIEQMAMDAGIRACSYGPKNVRVTEYVGEGKEVIIDGHQFIASGRPGVWKLGRLLRPPYIEFVPVKEEVVEMTYEDTCALFYKARRMAAKAQMEEWEAMEVGY